MPRLAELLGAPMARIDVVRIGPAGPLPKDAVALALCTADDGQRPFAALLVPLEDARRIVDVTLRRAAGSTRAPLSSGEEGVLLYALDRAGGDWLAAGGAPCRITGLLADSAQIAELFGREPGSDVELSLAAGDIAARFRIRIGTPPDPGRKARCAGELGRALGWRASFRCAAGSARVPAEEVRALAAGDVVVLDSCGHPRSPGGDRDCALVCGGVRLAARWLDDRSLLLVSHADGSKTMTDEKTARIDARLDAPIDGAAMEVEAQIEVGRITLTVGQALGLVPGRVLSLDKDVGPEVWIRVGDKLIARGELVSCDGRLAVEVTEVP